MLAPSHLLAASPDGKGLGFSPECDHQENHTTEKGLEKSPISMTALPQSAFVMQISPSALFSTVRVGCGIYRKFPDTMFVPIPSPLSGEDFFFFNLKVKCSYFYSRQFPILNAFTFFLPPFTAYFLKNGERI